MLETRELYKVYKPKKGVAVTALNKVSLKFPEKGMVFLLGKSGSGKSTLLNLLGGLDKYDSGEIIIKGVSSKDFDQQHFDSYRNTYVGFIFQEYNVLDEFTVGANIALALELQGKKATDEEINEILREVDLEGYGSRKPNELSGGQKQRVAIARALVKNPEIIMADEPTGALDSNTGKQVFDTLKKLSQEKLVIIVSHDREFSELYADRIIELADGNVISDMEVDAQAESREKEGNLSYAGDTITLAAGYHLTEEDRIAINEYIDRVTDQNLNLKLTSSKMAAKKFVDTNQDAIKSQDGSSFQLIKSKLPLKSAFKIGVSGLKYKKFRLVITILLSCIAFGLFGLADTFGAYNHINACTNSVIDSDIDYVSLVKAVKAKSGDTEYYDSYNTSITKEELEEVSKNVGVKMTGVFSSVNVHNSPSFNDNLYDSSKMSETDYNIYATQFSGFADITESALKDYGYELVAGTLPDGTKDEIAISDYVFRSFQKAGYARYDEANGDTGKKEIIENYADILGKTLYVSGREYVITGIIDTKFNFDRYKVLMEKKENQSTADTLVEYALMNEFSYAASYSLAGAAFTGEGKVDELLKEDPDIAPLRDIFVSYYSSNYTLDSMYAAKLENVKNLDIIWLDGEKTELAENELIVSKDAIMQNGMESGDFTDEEILAKLKMENFTITAYERNGGGDITTQKGYKIVGIIPTEKQKQYSSTIAMSDSEYAKYIHMDKGAYSYMVGAMPEKESEIRDLVAYCYKEDGDVQYQLQNAVTYELDTIHSVLKVLSKIFLYVGIGFAAFASIMLANFIGTSIAHKKQEIGILRAIGSRSNDVFRIFFSESFVIAMINFVLASVGVGVVTTIINVTIRNRLNVLVTVLNFGIRQVALLFVVSIVVAALASFLPVKKIASKRPIDAIRNR
ncbi:MAG: ATP-binding cassette domain-containing protein [Lachnospiraceae bacterium]